MPTNRGKRRYVLALLLWRTAWVCTSFRLSCSTA
jgi:hypothetical protein